MRKREEERERMIEGDRTRERRNEKGFWTIMEPLPLTNDFHNR